MKFKNLAIILKSKERSDSINPEPWNPELLNLLVPIGNRKV